MESKQVIEHCPRGSNAIRACDRQVAADLIRHLRLAALDASLDKGVSNPFGGERWYRLATDCEAKQEARS